MSKLQQTVQDWKDLDPSKKGMLGAVAATMVLIVVVHAMTRHPNKPTDADDYVPPAGQVNTAGAPVDPGKNHFDVLPKTQRNQGLEDMSTRLDRLEQMQRDFIANFGPNSPQVKDFNARYFKDHPNAIAQAANAASAPSAAASRSASVSLDEPLSNDFGQPGGARGKTPPSIKWDGESGDANYNQPGASATPAPAPPPPRPKPKSWPSDNKPQQDAKADVPVKIIPVNSAIDAVMLSGINARPPGTTTGAAGSSTSALNIGAPFVTRLKGNAILPNGWRVADLGDCFMSGSAIGILSTQRADAIAADISCIDANGEAWEGKVKAYALDVDGTQGIAGHVVNKQGAILMQATLAGIASGIGQAFSPTAISGYNSNAQSGSQQGYQLPNGSLIAGTAVGQGINAAGSQISKFYLDFAKEIFPSVEVVAGTRCTWVFKETLELKPRRLAKAAG
ncbi:type VI secretion protein [Pelomonas sp. HMWF004]|nr:type VI secretion protein [Pelomonas sp. HMWF004]